MQVSYLQMQNVLGGLQFSTHFNREEALLDTRRFTPKKYVQDCTAGMLVLSSVVHYLEKAIQLRALRLGERALGSPIGAGEYELTRSTSGRN